MRPTFPLGLVLALGFMAFGAWAWRESARTDDLGYWRCLRTDHGNRAAVTFMIGALILVASVLNPFR